MAKLAMEQVFQKAEGSWSRGMPPALSLPFLAPSESSGAWGQRSAGLWCEHTVLEAFWGLIICRILFMPWGLHLNGGAHTTPWSCDLGFTSGYLCCV